MHISVSVFSLDQPTPNPSKEGDRSVAEVSIDVRLPSWEGLGVGSGHELRMNNSPLKSHRFINLACAQADKSYCFDQRKPVPDLAIEVVITGEREPKLKQYAALGVPEVWFWIEGEIRMYCLNNGRYIQPLKSIWLPRLDIDRLAMCATIEFRTDAVAAFTDGMTG